MRIECLLQHCASASAGGGRPREGNSKPAQPSFDQALTRAAASRSRSKGGQLPAACCGQLWPILWPAEHQAAMRVCAATATQRSARSRNEQGLQTGNPQFAACQPPCLLLPLRSNPFEKHGGLLVTRYKHQTAESLGLVKVSWATKGLQCVFERRVHFNTRQRPAQTFVNQRAQEAPATEQSQAARSEKNVQH